MFLRTFLFLVSLVGLQFVATAQTFSGFTLFGATASQVDGDDLAGFNKLGFLAGAGVYIDLSDRWRTSMALAFVQSGSRANSKEVILDLSAYDHIDLNYVAIPVQVHYMDWLSNDEFFYRLEFTAGLEYRRLMQEKVVLTSGLEYEGEPLYRNNVLGATGGMLYALSMNWATGVQFNRTLTGIQSKGDKAQHSKQFSLRVRYTF